MKTFYFFLLRKLLYLPVRIFLIQNISGIDTIPKKGSAILVFNHQSLFDFICFVAIAPRNVYYLTAEKFYSHPFWRPVMQMTGQIKVERTSSEKTSVHKAIKEKITNGDLVGIFPEGTRAPEQGKMLPGYIGAARYALSDDVPIIPIGIKGADILWSRHESLPKIQKKICFVVGQQIDPVSYKKEDMNLDVQATHMTQDIMETLAELSERVCGGVHEKK